MGWWKINNLCARTWWKWNLSLVVFHCWSMSWQNVPSVLTRWISPCWTVEERFNICGIPSLTDVACIRWSFFWVVWINQVDIARKPLLALIDRPFGCPVIYTNTNSQCHFIHGHLNNAWHKNAHSRIGKPCLMIISSMIVMIIFWFSIRTVCIYPNINQ